ncbi:hypothetical protein HMPREF0591_0854, partial [Mycobacterium parascrofulaceum ATCC BAA-614]
RPRRAVPARRPRTCVKSSTPCASRSPTWRWNATCSCGRPRCGPSRRWTVPTARRVAEIAVMVAIGPKRQP